MGRSFQSPKLSPDEQKQPIGPSQLAPAPSTTHSFFNDLVLPVVDRDSSLASLAVRRCTGAGVGAFPHGWNRSANRRCAPRRRTRPGTSGAGPSTRSCIGWCGSIWRRSSPRSRPGPARACPASSKTSSRPFSLARGCIYEQSGVILCVARTFTRNPGQSFDRDTRLLST